MSLFDAWNRRSPSSVFGLVALTLGALASLMLPVGATAQQGAQEVPIRLVVAYPPGGTADTIARTLAEGLAPQLGRLVIVENRPGANGNIAAEQVARSSVASAQFLVSAPGPLAVNASLYPNLPFDPKTAFAPVARVAVAPLLLVVAKAIPATNLQELLAYVAAHPDKANFASQGNASSGHLAMELLKVRTGMKAVHVPYKGSTPALNDLLAGHVTMMFDNTTSSLPHVRSGALRAIAVAEPQRIGAAPDVPTVAESGVPGFAATPWFGIAAVAGTSPELIQRISDAIHAVLRSEQVKSRFANLGVELVIDTPSAFTDYIQSERDKWSSVIRTSGARAD